MTDQLHGIEVIHLRGEDYHVIGGQGIEITLDRGTKVIGDRALAIDTNGDQDRATEVKGEGQEIGEIIGEIEAEVEIGFEVEIEIIDFKIMFNNGNQNRYKIV